MSHRPALVVEALVHVPEPQPGVEAVGELEEVLHGVVLVGQGRVHGLELQTKKGDPYQEKYLSRFLVATTLPDGNKNNAKNRFSIFFFCKIINRLLRRLLKGTRWVILCYYSGILTDPY